MSQQQRLIYLPLIGTTLLCLLVGVYLVARKRFKKSTPATTSIKHTVETPPDDALTYWTTDRMRNAKATPLPKVNTLDEEKHHPPHTPRSHNA